MNTETLFASSLQTTQHWLDELSQDMNWSDARRSYQVLRSVLHALRDRLPPEEAVHLAAQMPLPVRGMYYEGWTPTGKPVKDHAEVFTARVEKNLRADNLSDADVNHAVHAVFRLLDRKITAGEIEDVKNVLPEDIRKLWPRLARA